MLAVTRESQTLVAYSYDAAGSMTSQIAHHRLAKR
jgi:YD repeat-containing protein